MTSSYVSSNYFSRSWYSFFRMLGSLNLKSCISLSTNFLIFDFSCNSIYWFLRVTYCKHIIKILKLLTSKLNSGPNDPAIYDTS
jgi:hypothetical protein